MGDETNVEVYWSADAQDAHLVEGILEDAGIAARVVGEMLQAGAGELAMGPGSSPRVWVSETDQARARTIVAEWEKQRRADRSAVATPWKCAQCGEDVEGNFDICWNCQSAKPSR